MAVIIMQECELYQYTLFTGSILLLASLFFNIKYRKKIKNAWKMKTDS
ncbi:hypothetical protein [Sulfurimonas sp. ST-27]